MRKPFERRWHVSAAVRIYLTDIVGNSPGRQQIFAPTNAIPSALSGAGNVLMASNGWLYYQPAHLGDDVSGYCLTLRSQRPYCQIWAFDPTRNAWSVHAQSAAVFSPFFCLALRAWYVAQGRVRDSVSCGQDLWPPERLHSCLPDKWRADRAVCKQHRRACLKHWYSIVHHFPAFVAGALQSTTWVTDGTKLYAIGGSGAKVPFPANTGV